MANIAARLDPETEGILYRLYREYFKQAEDTRRWNPWGDIPWDDAAPKPSGVLVANVMASYRDDLFLPDYSAKMLEVLRSSRGRAWFTTRWSYEKGKYLIALSEWLVRSGVWTPDALRDLSDSLLAAYRWEPPFLDAPALFMDSLLWELRLTERCQNLSVQAEEANDQSLLALLRFALADQEAARQFFHDVLRVIAERYPDLSRDASERVAAAQEPPFTSNDLLFRLDLMPG